MPDWYERLIGSDPTVANHNDDPDRDGWTLLEDYLEFLAHPYLIIEPGQTQTLDMAPYFQGFYGTNGHQQTPSFSVSTTSPLFTVAVSGDKAEVKANTEGGIGTATMTVTDSDGTSFSQRFSVAVTGDVSAIQHVWDESDIEVAKREFFTLDGKQVTRLNPREIYLMKITDTQGKVHSVKIIKD